MKIKKVKRKALIIRDSGRSSDFITPSFGYGCVFKCAYCYMRRNVKEGLSVAENTGNLLDAIHRHLIQLPEKVSNQTHHRYWTYDLSCNEDFAAHAKYHEWKRIFDYFKYSPNGFGTFATKFVNKNLLDYSPNKKIRIRFSMMPQRYSDILEPNTSKIVDRLEAVKDFFDQGYEVHLNFSPVIFHPGAKEEYTKLFQLVNKTIPDQIKYSIESEVIMLTHNESMHQYNLINNPKAEELLWKPDQQEGKITSYGGKALRYKAGLKSQYIREYKKLHREIMPWNKIRYIF